MASIGQLLRGSDNAFFDLFERAGANVIRAAELLDELLSGFPDSQILARDILVCEQKGDQLTREIVRKLNQSFVTPIDREDILRLSSALDDVVDFTEEVADYLGLYRIEAPMLQAQALAHVLLDATRHIETAIPLVRDYKNISEHTVEIHRLENENDQIMPRAIASKQTVAFASLLNFINAFISLKVATTIAKDFIDTDTMTTTVVFYGL